MGTAKAKHQLSIFRMLHGFFAAKFSTRPVFQYRFKNFCRKTRYAIYRP